MADVLASNSFKVYSAAGTTCLADSPAILYSVSQPSGTGAGTLAFYNVGSAAGTATANLMFTYVCQSNLTAPNVYNVPFNKGIVAANTGTATTLVTWQ
jgi:hypothetical protein